MFHTFLSIIFYFCYILLSCLPQADIVRGKEMRYKSLLPSLYKREGIPLFGKEGLGEIFWKRHHFCSIGVKAKETPDFRPLKTPFRGLSPNEIPDQGLLPETFSSLISKKGVYYNPYFTMDNPDSEGG
jgi:hypothetical protein